MRLLVLSVTRGLGSVILAASVQHSHEVLDAVRYWTGRTDMVHQSSRRTDGHADMERTVDSLTWTLVTGYGLQESLQL